MLLESVIFPNCFSFFVPAAFDLPPDQPGAFVPPKKQLKYVSFRDKAIQYPRIILNTQHPPLTESNCSELKFIAGQARLFRDAIVHGTPKIDLSSFDPSKEQLLSRITLNIVEEIVDNAVILVRKIEEAILGNTKRMSWLIGRDERALP